MPNSNRWHWVALALTLIGLFPTLGSLVKGCFKVLFAYGRKAMFSAGKTALDADMWQACRLFVERSIGKLNDFLARPEVRKTLKALKIDNPTHPRNEQYLLLASTRGSGAAG